MKPDETEIPLSRFERARRSLMGGRWTTEEAGELMLLVKMGRWPSLETVSTIPAIEIERTLGLQRPWAPPIDYAALGRFRNAIMRRAGGMLRDQPLAYALASTADREARALVKDRDAPMLAVGIALAMVEWMRSEEPAGE